MASNDVPPQGAGSERRFQVHRLLAAGGWGARALILIATVVCIGALKLAQAAVVPVLFAVFVALLLSPAVDGLRRRQVPRILAAMLVMTVLLAIVGACLSVTWKPARDWLDAAPATFRKLEAKVRPVTRFISKVESVSTQAERMTEPSTARRDAPTPVALESKGFVQSTQEWVIAIVSMVFLTFFLLATDLGRPARDGPEGGREGRAVLVYERVRADLGRYFSAVTLSNLVLGTGTAIAMFMLDMPSPVLWGVVAFALNFIPYAGSATTLVLLTVVALVSFDGATKALTVAGIYLLLTTLEGQVLQPVLVGRRLDVSPPVVLLGLWFGGWLWGVAGVALAIPLLVSVKAALREVERSRVSATSEPELETVRTRATELLRASARRYRKTPGVPSPARAGKVAVPGGDRDRGP
jgi:predicted PurR-regulated permease PerM